MDTEPYRQALEAEKQRVERIVDDLRHELGDESESDGAGELAAYDQHPADSASDTFEREKDLAILEGLEHELAEIEAALERIESGTYGIDESTGEPIAPERLEALPTARTNVPPGPPGPRPGSNA